MTQPLQITLATPRGFCAGVVRAIETVKINLAEHGVPIYVLHEIVHNKHVIAELEHMGARFVNGLSEVPKGGICVFSAHGVSCEIEETARRLGLQTIDATCPLVTSIHRMVERYHYKGYSVIIIGHHGHPEVVGTAGRVPERVHVVADEHEASLVAVEDPGKVAYVTQTTLSQLDVQGVRTVLRSRFPDIIGPQKSNICYATENRQNAVRQVARQADLIFVVGSKNSSNSNRLREVAQEEGCTSYLIDDWSDIDSRWLEDVGRLGITAGASAPERLVHGVLDWLNENFQVASIAEMKGVNEHISFKPATLDIGKG